MRGGSAFPDQREEESDVDTSSEAEKQTPEIIVIRGQCMYLQSSQEISGSHLVPPRPWQYVHELTNRLILANYYVDTRTMEPLRKHKRRFYSCR